MKHISIIVAMSVLSLLLGCSSVPVATVPVGPNPVTITSADASNNGRLEVFSALRWCSEGNNPGWKQHTDYSLFDERGHFLKRVRNTVGYYAQAPAVITLPAGKYLIKAEAKDYPWVQVSVVIVAGRTTDVHLDDKWRVAAVTPKNQIVSLDTGYPLGWRTDLSK